MQTYENNRAEKIVFEATGINEEIRVFWRSTISMVDRNCPVSSEPARQQQNRGKRRRSSMLISPAKKTQETTGSSPCVMRDRLIGLLSSQVLGHGWNLSSKHCYMCLWLYPNYL